MAALELLIGLAILGVLGGIVAALGIWVFRPLDTAAKGRRCPTQFTIVDFLCLFVIVQAPTALIHSKAMADAGGAIYLLDAFVWIACGLIWWKSVEVMSRAGIYRPWHRIVFLTVVFPVTLVASMAAPILPFAAVMAAVEREPTVVLAAVFLGFVAAVGLMFSAWFTRRMVAAATPREREPDAGEVGEAMMACADARRHSGDAPVE